MNKVIPSSVLERRDHEPEHGIPKCGTVLRGEVTKCRFAVIGVIFVERAGDLTVAEFSPRYIHPPQILGRAGRE